MKIAKPLLLVSTPLGMVTGLIEACRMVGGLAIRREKKWTASRS
jgi:phage-related protein